MRQISGALMLLLIMTFSINSFASDLLPEKEHEVIRNILRDEDSLAKQARLDEFLRDKNEIVEFILLPVLSVTCIQNKDYEKAEKNALKLLNLADKYKDNWNYGNAIHDGNMILGIVEVHNNDIKKAKSYLFKAGAAPSSPQLQVYGPNMMLADILLDAGEDDAVISYFQSVKKMWINNEGRLDSWIASVKGGAKPYFGINLPYKR